MQFNATAVERFWSHVRKGPSCWEWKVCKRGYPSFATNGRGSCERANRVSWTLVYGPIPEGFDVLHKCDNPKCVRPTHLFLGTAADNVADAFQKGRAYDGYRYKCARLSAADALAIRLSTEPQPLLAERYGVTPGHISEIQTGKTWIHLPVPGRPHKRPSNHRLTAEDVQAIRASQEPGAVLAARYAVTRHHVYQIKAGRRCKTLSPCGQ